MIKNNALRRNAMSKLIYNNLLGPVGGKHRK